MVPAVRASAGQAQVIPRRLIRTVPEAIDPAVEQRWAQACDLHPGWEHVTFRDPLDHAMFPLTCESWPYSKNGAQFAGLIRLEALWTLGGIYLDSDVTLYRTLDPLLACEAFAAWEDAEVVPDAVVGAEAGHPAIMACLLEALRRIETSDTDWRTGNGAWSTGPGVFTELLPGRSDVLLLPPGSFYPVHYTDKAACATHTPAPWTFGMHLWTGSWLG